MDGSMLAAAGDALLIVFDPFRLTMLGGGVLLGLFLGIVPGIGGLAGMALLLPFTYTMDPYAAFAMLLGMSAVTGTSDTIPAVLFGVPGTAGAQATVLDGNPMAKKGEAGRALSAAYVSSLIGGLSGAALLAISLPILRPMMLYIGSPELLALAFFGIAMVASLSGRAPLRGLIAAGIGIMLSLIGPDTQVGELRWTFGILYLWEGLPLVPMVLGLFALPELADLAINRQSIASEAKFNVREGMWVGARDALRNWWLVIRCGAIGAGVGAIPGLGSSVVDWIAYGHALHTVKGASETFGTGDVRGVIAPESANNAITAGALVPTIAFAVPGSASMAILLSVFLLHGLVPGPDMLTVHLDLTYSMIWSIGIANLLGAGICFAFSGQLARVALLRYTLILPPVLTFIFVGAFQASRQPDDLIVLLLFGVLGWIMKRLQWPRPPMILGFVLGALIERYMFISVSRYGIEWLSRPFIVVVAVISMLVLLGPTRRQWKAVGGYRGIVESFGPPSFRLPDLMHVAILIAAGYMVIMSLEWQWSARIAPTSIGVGVVILTALSLLNQVFTRTIANERIRAGTSPEALPHFDTPNADGDLAATQMIRRATTFLGFCVAFLALIWLIGFLPAIVAMVALYMWIEGRERWSLILAIAVPLVLAVWVVFDQLLHLPWMDSIVGQWLPALRTIPSM